MKIYKILITTLLAICISSNLIGKSGFDWKFKKENIIKTLDPNAYVLTWTRTEFFDWYKANDKEDSKIMFRFEYKTNYLILAGWAANEDDYKDYEPTIELTPNKIDLDDAKNLETNQNIYLGNLKLKSSLVRRIRKALNNDSSLQFILFKPEKDDDKHLYYDIYLSTTAPTKAKNIKAILGNKVAKTDPSPPATSK